MKVISVVSQKGGCGKTSLAVHLSMCAVQDGFAVALIDLDPQGSAFSWWESREDKTRLVAIKAKEQHLSELFKKAEKGGVDLVILDTSPHSNKTAAIAAKSSDFILIPCRPSMFDLQAVGSTLKIASFSQTPHAVVLNFAPLGKLADQVIASLTKQKVPVLPDIIHQRVAIMYSVANGGCLAEYEKNGKAESEIKNLFSTLKKGLGLYK